MTWNEVKIEHVYALCETATEGRLARAMERIEWRMRAVLDTYSLAEACKEIEKYQLWYDIIKEQYEKLMAARLEEEERPSKCPWAWGERVENTTLTKRQLQEKKKRQSRYRGMY